MSVVDHEPTTYSYHCIVPDSSKISFKFTTNKKQSELVVDREVDGVQQKIICNWSGMGAVNVVDDLMNDLGKKQVDSLKTAIYDAVELFNRSIDSKQLKKEAAEATYPVMSDNVLFLHGIEGAMSYLSDLIPQTLKNTPAPTLGSRIKRRLGLSRGD